MNIVHFGKFYYPISGGIESVNKTLADGAAVAGHKVSVIYFSKSCQITPSEMSGVDLVACPYRVSVSSQPISISYLINCVNLSKGVDIVHIHAPNLLAFFALLFISRKTKILIHWHSDIISKGFLGILIKPLEVFAIKRATKIISTTLSYTNNSKLLNKYRDKVVTIPIGIPDNSIFSLSKLNYDLNYFHKLIESKRLILSVGRLVDYKGFDTLIRASNHFPSNVITIIVGTGPLFDNLNNLIILNKLTDRVILMGRLSNEELFSLFTLSTIFCLPSISRAEAFGVVIIEAMAHGIPIVATDILGSGVQWVNQHGVTGYNVAVGNPEALANACIKILSNDSIRRNFSVASRQRYLNEFTEPQFISRTLELYKEVFSY
jgi:glycosyltransferase involved in cell wall biosynthesis